MRCCSIPNGPRTPWEIVAAFAVLFLPYSVLGPFAGALLDRWDRRLVLVGANFGRLVLMLGIAALLAAGASDLPILFGALIANGFTRFVSSGLSAALPDVVPREHVVTMNSVATATGVAAAFLGAGFMLVPRWLFGARDTGAAAIILLVVDPGVGRAAAVGAVPAARTGPARQPARGPRVGRATRWPPDGYTARAPWWPSRRVAATLAGLAAHRMVFGINSLLVLVIVRHSDAHDVAGLGTAALFAAAAGVGSFLATVLTPAAVAPVGPLRAPPTGRWLWRRSSSSAPQDCSYR